ncbi:hypothetical protein RB195_025699 [Necator americanus]|uniref:Uncharacterized protein n=1 Tax=Necator americanus TaxID=51031 RepID=A0ABR1ETH1_NECAM
MVGMAENDRDTNARERTKECAAIIAISDINDVINDQISSRIPCFVTECLRGSIAYFLDFLSFEIGGDTNTLDK